MKHTIANESVTPKQAKLRRAFKHIRHPNTPKKLSGSAAPLPPDPRGSPVRVTSLSPCSLPSLEPARLLAAAILAHGLRHCSLSVNPQVGGILQGVHAPQVLPVGLSVHLMLAPFDPTGDLDGLGDAGVFLAARHRGAVGRYLFSIAVNQFVANLGFNKNKIYDPRRNGLKHSLNWLKNSDDSPLLLLLTVDCNNSFKFTRFMRKKNPDRLH